MSKNINIDFSPLEGYRLRDIVVGALRQTFRSKRYLILNLVWALLVIPYTVIMLVDPKPGDESPLNNFVYFAIFWTIWVAYYIYTLRGDKIRQFAAANKWTIRPYEHGDPLPLCLTSQGATPKAGEVLEMTIAGMRWDLFCKEAPQDMDVLFTVLRVKLPKNTLTMLLDSSKTRGRLLIPPGWEELKLEGNFPKSFKLFIPPGSHIAALSCLTPDFMYALQQNNVITDIEVTNGYLYIMTYRDCRDAKTLSTIIDSLPPLYKKIAKC